MIKKYIIEESIEFCLAYMAKANPIELSPKIMHDKRSYSAHKVYMW